MQTQSSDKNLLFSIVMLRNGFIRESQFAQLLNQWARDSSKPISELAIEKGWLDTKDIEAIDLLVERQVHKHGNIEASVTHHSKALEPSSIKLIDSSVWNLLAAVSDHTLPSGNNKIPASESAIDPTSMTQTSVLKNNTSDTDFSIASASGAIKSPDAVQDSGSRDDFSLDHQFKHARPTPGHSRFSVLRPHAKGGLGKVSVALDTELDREVALKEIRSTYVDDPTSRDRFELEACITGGLEHPGVVPVYGFGKNTDGTPYFAMRFIRGQTLKDAVIDFHKKRKDNDSAEQRMQFRNLLTRFIDACHALAYAHNRGVIHRDVKPSNIMLGKFGETLVVDWGLAKKTDRDDHHYIDDESSIVLRGNAMSGTLDGSTVGTPTFMSPEQAAGKLHEMRPASDIYSLGSTLYYLLTGKTAFTGSSATEVVSQVCENHFRPPTEVEPSIPKALNSICCKAMSTRPVDRYTTAMQLAADVENWMADEPVSAHTESSLQKVGRWIRRHKTFATSAAVLAMTLTTASLVGMFFVNAEKNRTVAAKEKVELANSELEVAQHVTATALTAETDARRQTREVLNTITDDFVGELLARSVELEDHDRKFFERVLSQYEALTKSTGDTPDARNIRADGFFRVGNLQRRLDDLDAAAVAYGNAENIWTSLVESNQEPNYRSSLAKVLGNHGILLVQKGKHKLAIEKEIAAEELLDGLIEEVPTEVGYQIELAKLLGNRGNAHAHLGEFKKSEKDHNAAIEIFTKLKSELSGKLLKSGHALALSNLGGLLAKQKDRLGESEKIYRQTVEALETISDLNSDAELERRLTVERQNLGNVLMRLNRKDEAIEEFQSAIETQIKLAERFPNLAIYKRDLARSRFGLATAMTKLGLEGSDTELSEAKKITDNLVSTFPARVEFKRDLADIFDKLGAHYRKRDPFKANEMYAKGLDLRFKIEGLDPNNLIYSNQAVAAEINFANFLRKSDELDDAIARYQSVMKKLENQGKANSKLIRATLFGLGDCYVKTSKHKEALNCWTQLVKNKKDPGWKIFELQRAICTVRIGEIEAGTSIANDILANEKDPRGITFYDIACCFAVAAQGAQDEAKVEQYAKRAVELLGKAGGKEFFSVKMRAHAANDVDLKVLRDRSDFQELCSQYEIVLKPAGQTEKGDE